MFIKLSATHAFNCIVLMVKFGRTTCEDIPPALQCLGHLQLLLLNHFHCISDGTAPEDKVDKTDN